MRIVKIFLILAMVICICSCTFGTIVSRANTPAYYDETTSHLTTKFETIYELRETLAMNEKRVDAYFGSSGRGSTEDIITPQSVTHIEIDPILPRRTDTCSWCVITRLYVREWSVVGLSEPFYTFHFICPAIRYNFGIGTIEKETAEKIHALSLRMIELSECK